MTQSQLMRRNGCSSYPPIFNKEPRMNSMESGLEIRVHLINGDVSRFVQDDPEAAAALLSGIDPTRLFEQRELIIQDHGATTVFPWSAVVRVDLVMNDYPKWPFPHGVDRVVEITAEEFQEKYTHHTTHSLPDERPLAGTPLTTYVEAELINREKLYLAVHGRVELEGLIPVDQSLRLHRFLHGPALYCQRKGSGAILINAESIVRLIYCPRPPETLPNAWQSRHLNSPPSSVSSGRPPALSVPV